jgi:hypothetical protein
VRFLFALLARLPGTDFLRRLGDRFVRLRVDPDFADLRGRLDSLEDAVRDIREQVEAQDRFREDQVNQTGAVRHLAGTVRFDLDRMSPSIAALEMRLEDLRHELDRVRVGEPVASSPSWQVLEEVRREHSQIRARLSTVASYEERLRRLEGTSAPTTQ